MNRRLGKGVDDNHARYDQPHADDCRRVGDLFEPKDTDDCYTKKPNSRPSLASFESGQV